LSERIQKVLAEAGVASRRAIESLIAEGRISVNGETATLGQKIEPTDRVKVDGRPVRLSKTQAATRVLLYKKRVGELVTRDDPEGRKTVFHKLPELETGRWIAVGRLDINTSGLLLLTNDGELARRLTHPSFELEREYAVRVLGEMTDEILDKLRKGVELEDGLAKFDSIVAGDNEDGEGANQWWLVTLREGRNREVRRLFESQGLQVSRLIRVRYGPLELGRGVKSGSYRELEPDEMKALMVTVGLAEERKAAPRRDFREKGESRTRPSPSSRRKPGSRGRG
jgi:23S rRNA pseudouridine2605 synthase